MSIESLKHPYESRSHIPSQEEEGMEAASPTVAFRKGEVFLPRNPVVTRGQDPELFWMGKYGAGDDEDETRALVRSLYRREHVSPEVMLQHLYRRKASNQPELLFDLDEAFGHALGHDELDKVGDYYQHPDGWTNRLVLGDSLLVMSSLLEREGYAGKVQCIYIDPPYGIKYGSNWQVKMTNRDVKDGSDEHLSAEPEQVKAYRDTWELGIHSYLSYLRDRLLVAKELLSDSGSCFVQISDENVHLVRCLMDEVFGSGNVCSEIIFRKTAGSGSSMLGTENDYILWYAKDINSVKFRQLFHEKSISELKSYKYIVSPDAETVAPASKEQRENTALIPTGWKLAQLSFAVSQDPGKTEERYYQFKSRIYDCGAHRHWKTTNPVGLDRLAKSKRLIGLASQLNFIRYFDDFLYEPYSSLWIDTGSAGYSTTDPKVYVVQTDTTVIERCILMATDPGDLVLDPTCGSGTTAYIAEQWGRRWITIDTSRIALNIAKTRIAGATYPFYQLADSPEGWEAEQRMRAKRGLRVQGEDEKPAEFNRDLRQGFVYSKVPHVKLDDIANDSPIKEETLLDKPEKDPARLRVAGPFTVETLQSLEVANPAELAASVANDGDGNFFEMVATHLKAAGIKNGLRNETARFLRVEPLAEPCFNAQGWWKAADGTEKRALFLIGPRFGTVSKRTVSEAARMVRELVQTKDEEVDWFVVLGFAFEDGLTEKTQDQGLFQISIVRMHDDLLQQGLYKKDKKAASFITVGEPDIVANRLDNGYTQVEIRGLDIYDPMSGQLKSRELADIAYWYLDEDYDGANFVTRQIFFCGGDKDEFDKWRKGLESLASPRAKRKAEASLRIELDEEAWERLYGYQSHPIPPKEGGRSIAVRVVSQFGEESTKVLRVE